MLFTYNLKGFKTKLKNIIDPLFYFFFMNHFFIFEKVSTFENNFCVLNSLHYLEIQ